MPRIYVLSGPDLGHSHDVGDGATLGRSPDCAVPLRDASVSRHHARLERTPEGWRIVDTGSRNGVFVGDERVPAGGLADGDEFKLGEVLLRFRSEVATVESSAALLSTERPDAPPADEPPPAGPALEFRPMGHSSAPPSAGSAEIELEGEWTEPTAPRFDPAGTHAAPQGRPAIAASGAPRAKLRSVATDQRAQRLAEAGVRAGGARPDARGVLQYHKQAQREGVLRQDLGQQPLWLRTVVVVLVIALAVALAWFGYVAATAVKQRVAAPDAVDAR